MNKKQTLIIASLFGFLAVSLGAFGAHALKPKLIEAGRFDTFETAVRYQFYHTFGMLVVAILMASTTSKTLRWASLCFMAGVLLFSGSLYVLCFTGVTALGAITPFGGLFFLAGWLLLAYSAFGSDKS